jgi:CubicO group peptidase (beta-lactamase class C family)
MGITPAKMPKGQVTTSLFSGRYQQGGGGYAFAGYAGWDTFQQAKQRADTQGLRLCGLNIYEDTQSTTWYTGVWIESNSSYGYWGVTDWNSFMQQFNQWASDGLSLVDINFAVIQGNLWYTGVWLGNQGKQALVHDLSWSDFSKEVLAQNANNMQLIKAQCRADGDNNLFFTGLFQSGSPANNGIWSGGSWADFYEYFQQDANRDNVNCLQVLDYGPQGSQNILAVWVPVSQPHKYVLGLDWDSFVAEWKTLSAQNYRLQSVEVQQKPVNWQSAIQQVLGSRSVGYLFGVNAPAAEIGASGYAIQPDSTQPGIAMTQDTPLTLGSVSKTIEAISMLLVIQNEPAITLTTPFFSIIDGRYGIKDSDLQDQRVKQITILDLLTHSAGLDDPPGPQNTNQTLWAYIKAYVSQKLNPQKLGPNGEIGVVYCYSNAGFQTIRGVVQAAVNASTYQDWVTREILAPLGANSTYIPVPGTNYNIRYYERNLVIAPPWDGAPAGVIANEASWNSSASDMLKILASLRGNYPLNRKSLERMFTARSLPYQYNGSTGQREAWNGQICLGFDATGTPAPPYVGKNGSYTNYSQAAVLRFNSPPIDVVVQANTDTATVPGTTQSDSSSIWPQNVILNAFNKMYY